MTGGFKEGWEDLKTESLGTKILFGLFAAFLLWAAVDSCQPNDGYVGDPEYNPGEPTPEGYP